MSATEATFLTVHDILEQIKLEEGGDTALRAEKSRKLAIQRAIREFPKAWDWKYYNSRERIVTSASQSDGTVAYTASSRQVVLTGSTWPNWAVYGHIKLNGVRYRIAERTDSTTIVLDSTSAPTEDIAAGSSYLLMRDQYQLPLGFRAYGHLYEVNQIWETNYMPPQECLEAFRLYPSTTVPRWHTFIGDPNAKGRMVLWFVDPPDAVYTFDCLYRRQPRPANIWDEADGTVSVSSGSKSVSGTNTAFNSKMVSSVIRFGTASNLPDPDFGDNPFAFEGIVASVESATALTLEQDAPEAATDVKYRISDLVDVDYDAMATAFERLVAIKYAVAMRSKHLSDAMAAYAMALNEARAADERNFQRRTPLAGHGGFRLRDIGAVNV